MKTIGVLGGFGPQATMDFEARVHRAAQRVIPPHLNGGYPPMVVFYCRHPPFVIGDDGQPLPPLRPDPRLLEAAERLGRLADFLVVPSNGVHHLREHIERASGRPLLSMIDVTVREVRRRGWRRVGVLGLGEGGPYPEPLKAIGAECETAGSDNRQRLNAAIFEVMEGRDNSDSASAAREAVAELRAKHLDGILLGCTELPLLLGPDADAPDLLNPGEFLAHTAVEAALATR